MALVIKNGAWHWRKMVDGVMFNRSTKTDDKKLAKTFARRREHEAVQPVAYDGERPVTVHQAIKGFLEAHENTSGYESACQHMNDAVRLACTSVRYDYSAVLATVVERYEGWAGIVIKADGLDAITHRPSHPHQ